MNAIEKMQAITELLRTANDAVDVEVATEPKMKKTNNPYYGRVTKHTAYLGVDFGANYTQEVNRRRVEEGKNADFQAQKSAYERVNEYFVCKGEQLYLQLILKQGGETKVIYELDERPATDSEITEFKTYFYASNKAANQGLSEGNEVQIRVVKIENIVAIGGKTWSKEV